MDDPQESPDLDAVAARAAAGDEEALRTLLVEIQPRVRRICARPSSARTRSKRPPRASTAATNCASDGHSSGPR